MLDYLANLVKKIKSFINGNLKIASILGLVTIAATFATNIGSLVDVYQKVAGLFDKNIDIESIKKDLSSDNIALHVDAEDEIEKYGILSEDNAKRAVALLEAFLQSSKIKGRDDATHAVRALSSILKKADGSKWSVNKPTIRNVDLSGLNLKGLYLSGITFENVNFQNTILDNSIFDSSFFSNSSLNEVQARNVSLISANISYSCLEGVDLSGSNMKKLQSKWSDFNAAKFIDADLSETVFEETIVRDATFKGANLSSAKFNGALELNESQVSRVSSKENISLPSPLFRKKQLTACKG